MKPTSSLKILALLPLVGGALTPANAASPLFDLGEGAAARLIAETGVVYSDNLYSTRKRTDDVSFYITPGLQLDIGSESNNQLTITAKEKLTAYVDNSDLNSALANVRADYIYNAGTRLQANVYGGFRQLAQNDNTTSIDGDLIKRNVYEGGATISYDLTAKSSLEVGFSYEQLQFRSYQDRYNDKQTYSVPVSWLYAVTDKVKAGLTYTYTYVDIDQYEGQDVANGYSNIYDPGNQQVHFVGFDVRGNLTEKIVLRTKAGVGYQEFNDRQVWSLGVPVEDNPDSTTFNFSLAADYQVTEKIATTLTAGRSFDVGGQAQGITNTYIRLSGNYAIAPQWEAHANVGFSYQDFEDYGRDGTDEITTFGVGASYLPSKYWRITLGYNFQNNHSDRIAGYSVNTVALTAAVKY